MKTLENEKGLDLKSCLNCVAIKKAIHFPFDNRQLCKICPCPNHAGKILRQNNIITLFNCANRKMHQAPKIKPKGAKKATTRRSK